MHKYGEELLRSAPSLGSRTASEILDTDRKSYEMGGVSISVSQVEVTGMQELPQRKEELFRSMDDRLYRENLALLCLMITDVVTGQSIMLARGDNNLVDSLPFSHVEDYQFDLGDIVSRKKAARSLRSTTCSRTRSSPLPFWPSACLGRTLTPLPPLPQTGEGESGKLFGICFAQSPAEN
jgi:hypothetical protein